MGGPSTLALGVGTVFLAVLVCFFVFFGAYKCLQRRCLQKARRFAPRHASLPAPARGTFTRRPGQPRRARTWEQPREVPPSLVEVEGGRGGAKAKNRSNYVAEKSL